MQHKVIRPMEVESRLHKKYGNQCLWFQPIHPNGIEGREPSDGWGGSAPLYDPGSPYAVKNFFDVNELMSVNYSSTNSLSVNRSIAMEAWSNFVSRTDSKILKLC